MGKLLSTNEISFMTGLQHSTKATAVCIDSSSEVWVQAMRDISERGQCI
jgi:hypothetical protein